MSDLGLLARFTAAIIAGVAIRVTRRVLGLAPRIVHGTYPMHMTKSMVDADRRAGFPSRSVVTHTGLAKYDLVKSSDFDVVLGEASGGRHWQAAIEIFRGADVWVTHFDSVFSGVNEERRDELLFRLFRFAGIRIIAMPNGFDVAYLDGRAHRFDWVPLIAKDYPAWNLAAETETRRSRNERFCRHATLVISDPQSSRFLSRTDLSFKYFPIETADLPKAGTDSHDPPMILHAPNHRSIKGTHHLLDSLEWLSARGVRSQVELVEKTPRRDAVRKYAEADILADQFRCGSFGVFALEAMALGKPVIAYLDAAHLSNPVFNLPIVNASPDSLPFVLAPLIRIPELRLRIGEASRLSVERYQSVEALGEVFAQIYENVWRGKPLHLQDTVHFGPERRARALTENPARPEFWPVPVDDLIDEIHSVLLSIGMSRSDLDREMLPASLWHQTSA